MGKLSLKINKRAVIVILVLIILIFSGIGLYLYSDKITSLNLLGGSEEEIEAENLISTVGEKFLLPDEIPTIATVSDKGQLLGQEFFKNAENGDKVLIYQSSGIAILYRPSIDKIINVGPVALEQSQIDAQNQATTSADVENLPTAEIIILNGTTTVGLTQEAASALSDVDAIEITDRTDAVGKPYEETLIVVLNSKMAVQGSMIQEIIGGNIESELPEDETVKADIVIILGNDYASE